SPRVRWTDYRPGGCAPGTDFETGGANREEGTGAARSGGTRAAGTAAAVYLAVSSSLRVTRRAGGQAPDCQMEPPVRHRGLDPPAEHRCLPEHRPDHTTSEDRAH